MARTKRRRATIHSEAVSGLLLLAGEHSAIGPEVNRNEVSFRLRKETAVHTARNGVRYATTEVTASPEGLIALTLGLVAGSHKNRRPATKRGWYTVLRSLICRAAAQLTRRAEVSGQNGRGARHLMHYAAQRSGQPRVAR